MYGLKPVPFVQSDSCSACAGAETQAYQPVPFTTDKPSPEIESAAWAEWIIISAYFFEAPAERKGAKYGSRDDESHGEIFSMP